LTEARPALSPHAAEPADGPEPAKLGSSVPLSTVVRAGSARPAGQLLLQNCRSRAPEEFKYVSFLRDCLLRGRERMFRKLQDRAAALLISYDFRFIQGAF
jgi:hypothetical protein